MWVKPGMPLGQGRLFPACKVQINGEDQAGTSCYPGDYFTCQDLPRPVPGPSNTTILATCKPVILYVLTDISRSKAIDIYNESSLQPPCDENCICNREPPTMDDRNLIKSCLPMDLFSTWSLSTRLCLPVSALLVSTVQHPCLNSVYYN